MADPINTTPAGTPVSTSSAEPDDLEQLSEETTSGEETESEDEEPVRKGSDGEDEDEEAEEDAEEEDDEEELGDIDDEDEEEEATIGDKEDERHSYLRPPIKAIKAKYPNLFKDFPQLKPAFFNYPQYTELFADVETAREAASKAAEYDNLEATIVGKGDAKLLLETLSENNPKALKKMVEGFSENVRAVDQDAYIKLSTPIIEELLYHAAVHASKVGNKNLSLAARHLANFVFANGGDIPDISKRTPEPKQSQAEKELEEERATYRQEKFTSALDDVVEMIRPDINGILGNKLDGLTGFERKQIIKEARAEVDKVLGSDKAFQQSIRNLWDRAAKAGYSSESKSRIKSAWLDRAKLVAPSVRNRLKQEAISSRNSKRKETAQKDDSESKIKFKVTSEKKTFPERGGKIPQTSHRRVLDPKKIDWRKTSDRDILDMK